jgi:hypothetical protein
MRSQLIPEGGQNAAVPGLHSDDTLDHRDDSGRTMVNSASLAPGSLLAEGGGRRSIREKFNVNAVTGGISLTVPIHTSPGRSDFGPTLALVYDSGTANANGVFGVGWHLLGVDNISRKTSQCIPLYGDGTKDTDLFLLSGGDDLVPARRRGEDVLDERAVGDFHVCRYRPRVETQAMRIERWANTKDAGDVYWQTISSQNVTTIFGKTNDSRIFANDDRTSTKRIFSWVACESYDGHGNHIVYSYKAENSAGVDQVGNVCEKSRTDNTRSTQRYLKSVKYGNLNPNRDMETWEVVKGPSPPDGWLFETVFDYGEHDDISPTTEPVRSWDLRPDPFSTYTSGFEVRTYRRCCRVLMFHHFPKELRGRTVWYLQRYLPTTDPPESRN